MIQKKWICANSKMLCIEILVLGMADEQHFDVLFKKIKASCFSHQLHPAVVVFSYVANCQ
jgi:hypothetical protein